MGQSLWRYLTFLFVSPHFITQSRRTVWDRRRDECQRPKPEMTFLTPCCWLYYTHLSVKLYSKWQHGPAGEKTDQMLFVAYIQLDSQNPSVPRRNVEFKSVTVLYIYIYINNGSLLVEMHPYNHNSCGSNPAADPYSTSPSITSHCSYNKGRTGLKKMYLCFLPLMWGVSQ